MFWKRATGHGAFAGLVAGTLAAALHHGLTLPAGAVAGVKGGWLALLHTYPSEMAQNFWTAIDAFTVCFVVTIASALTTSAAARSRAGRPCYCSPNGRATRSSPGTSARRPRRHRARGDAVLNMVFF